MKNLEPGRSFLLPLAVGVAIGVATHNLALWICIGIAVGVVLSSEAQRRNRPDK